jgi:hypothetical protein
MKSGSQFIKRPDGCRKEHTQSPGFHSARKERNSACPGLNVYPFAVETRTVSTDIRNVPAVWRPHPTLYNATLP